MLWTKASRHISSWISSCAYSYRANEPSHLWRFSIWLFGATHASLMLNNSLTTFLTTQSQIYFTCHTHSCFCYIILTMAPPFPSPISDSSFIKSSPLISVTGGRPT